jgi:hypothetical protein
MADFTDQLYFSLNLQDQLGLVTGTNNRIYVLARTARPPSFTGYILTIAPGSYATIAAYIAAVQAAFRAVWPAWTITPNGDKYRITTDANITLIIPSFSDLTNPDWIRENWTGPSYNPNATNSANPGFRQDITVAGSWDGEIGMPLTSVVENIAVQLTPGQYSGTDFATLIQVALRSGCRPGGRGPRDEHHGGLRCPDGEADHQQPDATCCRSTTPRSFAMRSGPAASGTTRRATGTAPP